MSNIENIKINSKQELYNFLNNFNFKDYKETELSSVYFLIEYDKYIEPLYFISFEDVWFESVCTLGKFPLKDTNLAGYIKDIYFEQPLEYHLNPVFTEKDFEKLYEYEKRFQIDGNHYEIDCFQTSPFLPEKFKIIKPMTETECLKWLINNNND